MHMSTVLWLFMTAELSWVYADNDARIKSNVRDQMSSFMTTFDGFFCVQKALMFRETHCSCEALSSFVDIK